MKGLLLLVLVALAYCIPNPVYVMKDCYEKLYGSKNANSDLAWSVENELLHWKVKEFFAKLDKVDPTLREKIEKCVSEVNEGFKYKN